MSESDEEAEIEALLDFDPVPRQRIVEGGWTPQLQRELICRLADHGSARRACEEMGKNQTGVMRLYRSRQAFARRGMVRSTLPSAGRRSAHVSNL